MTDDRFQKAGAWTGEDTRHVGRSRVPNEMGTILVPSVFQPESKRRLDFGVICDRSRRNSASKRVLSSDARTDSRGFMAKHAGIKQSAIHHDPEGVRRDERDVGELPSHEGVTSMNKALREVNKNMLSTQPCFLALRAASHERRIATG